MANWLIGVDTGGTFTDLIAFDQVSGALQRAKVLSVPSDPSLAVLNALEKLLAEGVSPADVAMIVHGTTVATFAAVEPAKGRYTATMAGPVLYSANPWFAVDLAEKYRKGVYFAWVCEFFDSEKAPALSAGSMIAPSSNPRKIYEDLYSDYKNEDEHSRIIRDHKKTFRRVGKQLLAAGEITSDHYSEIIASVEGRSWKIWKPVLYVIPRAAIAPTRIHEVKRADRASYGPEFKIVDLTRPEFDIVDLSNMRVG